MFETKTSKYGQLDKNLHEQNLSKLLKVESTIVLRVENTITQ